MILAELPSASPETLMLSLISSGRMMLIPYVTVILYSVVIADVSCARIIEKHKQRITAIRIKAIVLPLLF